MTDAVITYVNGADPAWQKEWEECLQASGMSQNRSGARWRDFGTLPLLVRCIRKKMPWVRRIYVIVSGETQIDRRVEGVEWVMHRDIMPEEVLPTFNSTVIELFMWRIKGLAEQFVYFNDDMFPVAPLREDEFFDEDGQPLLTLRPPKNAHRNMYAFHLRNTYGLAASVAGKRVKCGEPPRFGHSASPMLRSTWEKLWKERETELMASCTPFRTVVNINQHAASYYQLLSGRWQMASRKVEYVTLNTLSEAQSHIAHGCQILCANDTSKTGDIEAARRQLRELLEHTLAEEEEDSDS